MLRKEHFGSWRDVQTRRDTVDEFFRGNRLSTLGASFPLSKIGKALFLFVFFFHFSLPFPHSLTLHHSLSWIFILFSYSLTPLLSMPGPLSWIAFGLCFLSYMSLREWDTSLPFLSTMLLASTAFWLSSRKYTNDLPPDTAIGRRRRRCVRRGYGRDRKCITENLLFRYGSWWSRLLAWQVQLQWCYCGSHMLMEQEVGPPLMRPLSCGFYSNNWGELFPVLLSVLFCFSSFDYELRDTEWFISQKYCWRAVRFSFSHCLVLVQLKKP